MSNELDYRLRDMLGLSSEDEKATLFDDRNTPQALCKAREAAILKDINRDKSKSMEAQFAADDEIMRHRARITFSTPGPCSGYMPSGAPPAKDAAIPTADLMNKLLGTEIGDPELPRLESVEDLNLGRPTIMPGRSGKSLLDGPIHEILEKVAARIPNAQGRAFASDLAKRARELEGVE